MTLSKKHHSAPLRLVVHLLTLIMILAPSIAAADPGRRIESTFFGLHVLGYARNGSWPTVPFGSIRLWDTGTAWLDLEPHRDEWHFGTLDAYVDKAEKSSVRILLTLGQTPAWAASDPELISPYGAGASSPPRRLADWDRYVRTLAERYKGRIRYWEIWNEYDSKHFYQGSLKTLAELECRAARILKDVDKRNMVLTPSDEGGDYRALKEYFDAGGGRCADIISYHFYAPTGKPEDMLVRVARVRALMHRYGQSNKPLWNTETGWLIANSDGRFGPRARPAWRNWSHIKGTEAAGWVLRALALMMNHGLEAFYWYAWDNQAMGLAEDHGRKVKPAAEAYRRAVLWFVGTRPEGCHNTDGLWECVFLKDGESLHLVWSDPGRRMYHIPFSDQEVSVSDFRGNTRIISPGNNKISVGPVPQLIRIP